MRDRCRVFHIVWAVVPFLVTACVDGGECLGCDTYLEIQVLGVGESVGPVTVRACDGAYCDTLHLSYGECESREPTLEPGFYACFRDESIGLWRHFTVRDSELPIPNDTVEIVVMNSSGVEIRNHSGVPSYVDALSCVEECTAREISFGSS